MDSKEPPIYSVLWPVFVVANAILI